MGIESDRLVFDYLSRVGDLAQQRQLPSGARMQLVSELRGEIDKRRSRGVGDSPAAVRRILSRLGSPDDVVDAARRDAPYAAPPPATTPPPATAPPPHRPAPAPPRADPHDAGRADPRPRREPPASAPVEQAQGTVAGLPSLLRRLVPGPRVPDAAEEPPPADPPPQAAPEWQGDPEEAPAGGTGGDWWRVDGGPRAGSEGVPGFVGGVEIPEILGLPPRDGMSLDKEAEAGDDVPLEAEEPAEPAAARPRRRLPRLWPARAAAEGRTGWTNPLLLLAAALLVAGAVLGNWFALGIGWVIAYASRRLTRGESKTAVFVLPGAALAAGLLWLWGRDNGKWGAPIADGHMGDAVSDTWPWVIRGAAVASALFLIWRSQRGRS